MTPPVVPDAERFQDMTDFPAKKKLVQELELLIQDRRLALDNDQRIQCAASGWDLDRIVLYLVEEHEPAAPNLRARRIRVQHEAERLRASAYEKSLMPLSYALGSFLAMLHSRPDLAQDARKDSRLFRDLRDDLKTYKHLDRDDPVNRDLDAILEALQPATAAEPSGSRNARRTKSFWTTMPGILTGVAAIITALTGLYLATKTPANPDAPPKATVPSNATTLLIVEGVELFPQEPKASVQVIADVNGTQLRYPSLAGVEWAEVGPTMASQQFRLPSATSYQVRFRMTLRLGGIDKDLVSQETSFVTQVPFSGVYRLHEREGSTRAAPVRAAISFSIRRLE